MAANPPMARGVTVASLPPTSITLASPRSMMRAASPMEWLEEEQADVVVAL